MCNTDILTVYEKASEIRRDIQKYVHKAEQTQEELKRLIQGKAKQGSDRPWPKTPREAPGCLYYFEAENQDYIDREEELNSLVDLRKITTFEMMNVQEHGTISGKMKGYWMGKAFPWTEDYLHIYMDGTVGTMLPFYNSTDAIKVIAQGQRERLEAGNPELYNALTTSYANLANIYMPEEHADHFFLRSMIDGGNMLTGSDFAVIGKDSLYITCVQNGMRELEAKRLIAQEMGYDINRLYFVEQPGTYHLDLNMMLLGKCGDGRERIWVGKDYKGISLECIHEELRGYGFEVIVDDEDIAGKAEGTVPEHRTEENSGTTNWLYNFFNGEFVYGRKDGKLYYVTNGTANTEAKEKFENQLKKYVSCLEKVIFCETMTMELFNGEHGGVGCRFKGGPARQPDGLFSNETLSRK